MGLDNIPSRATGDTILDDFFNVLKRVLGLDFVPRNVSGVATANVAHLGTETYPWKRAHITTGYFVCGDVKLFHDFNGELTPGQGWMKCNGDQVTQAAYDVLHGAGSWATYIGSSPIGNKYLPNMNDRFAVGATNTTQDGDIAITPEGNADHEITSSNHTHSVPNHIHKWYDDQATNTTDQTYDSNGNATNIAGAGAKSGGSLPHIVPSTAADQALADAWTNGSGVLTSGSAGTETLNIKPESHAFEFWMRII